MFHLSWCRGIRPYLQLSENLLSFGLVAGNVGFLSSAIGETGLLLMFKGNVWIPLESKQGKRPSS